VSVCASGLWTIIFERNDLLPGYRWLAGLSQRHLGQVQRSIIGTCCSRWLFAELRVLCAKVGGATSSDGSLKHVLRGIHRYSVGILLVLN